MNKNSLDSTQNYLISQPPFAALVRFALPIMLGNLFQQLYTMADSAILGRFVGEEALAAVGASYSLTTVFICVAIGGGIGSSVLVSRYFGAKDYERMKCASATAFISFFFISVVLAVVGVIVNRPLLVLLRTPQESFGMAAQYLHIYFLGLPFLFMYNVVSAMFNALGKSRLPLCFLIFSSILNITLDLVFVVNMGLGVAGAAWGTLIAQGVSAAASFVVFLFVMRGIGGRARRFFDAGELLSMARIAIPSVFQQSTVSIGMMLMQSVVNSFGAEMLAGYSAFSRIASIAIVPMVAIYNSLSSYTAQNLGAGKEARVVQGYHVANAMVAFFAVLLCVLIECFHKPLILLFLGTEGSAAALQTGTAALRFEGFFYCLIGFKMATDGVLRGAGDMRLFTIANFVNLSIRVAVSAIFAPRYGIQWVWYSVPMGWGANFIISYCEYRTGKWRNALVKSAG